VGIQAAEQNNVQINNQAGNPVEWGWAPGVTSPGAALRLSGELQSIGGVDNYSARVDLVIPLSGGGRRHKQLQQVIVQQRQYDAYARLLGICAQLSKDGVDVDPLLPTMPELAVCRQITIKPNQ